MVKIGDKVEFDVGLPGFPHEETGTVTFVAEDEEIRIDGRPGYSESGITRKKTDYKIIEEF